MWGETAAIIVPLSNSTLTEPMGGGVPDIMLKTPPRLGLRAARHERGTETLVAVREERHVWAVEGGSDFGRLQVLHGAKGRFWQR